MRTIVRILLAGALLLAAQNGADANLTNTWPFTNPGEYRVSDSTKIEVADGVAKLRLQRQQRYEDSTVAYLASNAINSHVEMDADVLLIRAFPYPTSASYESRIFRGVSGNVWQRIGSRAFNTGGMNAGGESVGTESGLVALYHLNNDNWYDVVSTSNGTPGVAARFSTIARLGSHSAECRTTSGSGFRLLNRNLLDGAVGYSVCFWVNMRSYRVAELVAAYGATHRGGIETYPVSDKLTLLAVGLRISSSTSLDLNRWYFVVGTWESSTGKGRIYIDGRMDTEGTASVGAVINIDDYFYGGQYKDGTYTLDGYLDEVMFFRRALSSDEVYQLYTSPRTVMFQVRSGTTQAILLGSAFSGPNVGNPSNSFYRGEGETLVTAGGFSPADPYLQYRAFLNGTGGSNETPFVDSVTVFGSLTNASDNTKSDFGFGATGVGVTNYPISLNTPYLGLAKRPNGGYYTNGTYTSRPLTISGGELWHKLKWSLPPELSTSDNRLTGLWHLNFSTADALGTHHGTNVNLQFSDQAKLGGYAAVFDGTSSRLDVGSLLPGSTRTLEVWLRTSWANGGLFEITATDSNVYQVVITNGLVTPVGFASKSATVFVNGQTSSRRLQPGWNHVAITLGTGVLVQNFVVGRVGSVYFEGMIDELVAYSSALCEGELKAHYLSGRRISAGLPKFRVRGADSLPMPSEAVSPFLDSSGGTSGYITDNTGGSDLSGNLPAAVKTKTYLQYRGYFDSDGVATPTLGNVQIAYYSGTVWYNDDSLDEFSGGTFDGGQTKWCGAEIRMPDLGAAPGLVDMDSTLSGLEGLWHMNETNWSGGGSVLDSRGGHNADPQGGVNVSSASRVGVRCGSFDGINDYVLVASGIALPGDCTVMGWFNTTNGNRSAVISHDLGRYAIEMNSNGNGTSSGTVAFVVNTGTKNVALASTANLNDGMWHHVAGIRAGGTIHILIDGTVLGSTTLVGGVGSLDGSVLFGKRGTANEYFQGNIDEVAIFSRALSVGEVQRTIAAGDTMNVQGSYVSQIYDATGPAIWERLTWFEDAPYGDALTADSANLLRGLWRFEEGAGGGAADSSGNSLSGTLNGGAGWAVGRLGGGVSLGGSAYVDVGDSVLLEPALLTVEAWVNPTTVGAASIVDKRNATDGYALCVDANGRPYFWLTGSVCRAVGGILPGGWSHVAGTYDGTRQRLYVDGQLVADGRGGPGGTIAAGNLRVGVDYLGGNGFVGIVDEVAVHGRALGSEEIMDHARAGVGQLRFQARTGNSFAEVLAAPFVGTGGLSTTYFDAATNTSLLGSVAGGQYFQLKAILQTEDGFRGPRLQGLSVSQSRYPSDRPWVSPTNGFGAQFLGRLVSFNHYVATNVDSAIRYQISGDNGTNWYWWNGSQWEADGLGLGWSLANSAATISNNVGTFYSQLYQARGGTFSFRAYLDSDGASQTAVDWVEMSRSRGRITVIQPNGTEKGEKAWVVGVPYPITWSSTGTVSGNIRIELYSQSGSNFVRTIGTNVPNTGVYTNVISEDFGADYRVRIRDLNDATIEDWSDGDFELVQNLHLSTPNGGEKWYVGETNIVRWEAPGWGGNNLGSPVWLWFSADAGTNWQVIATPANVVGNDSFAWLTPSNNTSIISERAKMGVSVTDMPDPLSGFADISDSTFTNAGIALSYPSAGAGIKMGNVITIRWTAAGAGASVAIDFYDGTSWSNITSNATCVPGENTYDAPLVAVNPTTAARVRISSNTDPKVWGISDPFTLADINIIEPIGGGAGRSKWQIGTTKKIKWTAGGAGGSVDIHYTVDGTTWIPIALNTPNINSGGTVITNESPDWAIQGPPTNMARVRIRSTTQSDLYSVTEPFDISGVYVSLPNGSLNDGTDWEFVDTNTVKWLSQSAGGQIAIEVAYEDNPATNEYEVVYGSVSIFLGQRAVPPNLIRRPSNYARIRVRALSPPADTELLPMMDASDGPFKIKGMSVVEPHTNVVYTMGATVPQGLQWYSASAGGTSARVYYSTNATGFPTNSFLSGLLNQDDGPAPGLNVLDFNVPRNQIPSIAARLKVAAGVYSAISAPFILRGIRITQPVAGQMVNVGALNQAVTWVSAGLNFSARAAGDVSTTGVGGPWKTGGMSTNINVINSAAAWNVDSDLDPTTNAVVRLSVFTPVADTDIVMYSDPFTLRGLKITSPAQGAVVDLGTPTVVTLMAAGMGVGARAAVYYAPDDVNFDLSYPLTNNMLVADGANTFTWNIDSAPTLTRMPSTNAHLMVVSGIYTNISRPFTVRGIKVTSPSRTDIWAVSDVTNTIRWTSVGAGPAYNLSFQLWSGGAVVYSEPIVSGYAGNQFVWTMTNSVVGSNVTITVRDATYTGYSEMFEVVPQPSIRIINPKVGDFWKVGTTNLIQWSRGGNMNNDFVVAYSVSPFDVTNELRRGACDYANGIFSLVWGPMPSTLGRTRIVITNRVDDMVGDSFENFYIAARFDIAPFPTDLYALETVGINWITRGEVSSVDLFYSTDTLRAAGSWVQINNPASPYSDNIGNDLPATAYPWLVPNIKTPAMWLRIQDHAFAGQQFQADVPGPFNDFGTFPVKYYSIVWQVLDAASSNNLDNLSVSDSSGWSAANLSSPVLHEYPYGVFDTVWFKEFFHDGVVFNWVSKPSRTNVVIMSRSDTEKNIQVLADFAFDAYTNRMTIHAWAQRSGLLLTDPTRCDVTIYSASGQTLMSLSSTTPLSDAGAATGVFRIEWNNVTNVLAYGGTYFAKVAVLYSGQTYSSIVTYTLRLAMDMSQGDAILNSVTNTEANLTNLVAAQSVFRSNVMSRLDTLTGGVAGIQTSLTNLNQSLAAFTNEALQSLNGIASNVLVILPKVTNIEARVEIIGAIQENTKSRILTRPDTMVFGTTNTVLYKTTPGLGTTVSIIVSNSISSEPASVISSMEEVVPGLYQKDLYAAWGTNSYIITCADPPTAPKPDWDSIVVRVGPPPLSGNATLDGLVDDVAALQARLVSVSNMVASITNTAALLTALDGRVMWVSNQLENVDWGAISNISGGLSLSNIYASVTNIQSAIGPITNMTTVVSNLNSVNWGALTNIQSISVAVTNIQSTLTNLSTVVNAVTNLGSLATILGGVDWSSLSNVATLGVSVSNMFTSVTNIQSAVGGITNLSALANSVGTITNALSSINWADIGNIQSGLTTLSTQLGGVDWGQMATLSASLSQALSGLEALAGTSGSDFANLSQAVANLGNNMPSASSISTISTQLRTVEQTLTALDRLESQFGSESDSAGTATLFGRLASIGGEIDVVTGKSSDAARKAAGAKTEAASAVNGIRGLKDVLTKGGSDEGIAAKIEQVRESIRQVQKSLGEVPAAKEADAMYGTVTNMAASIEEFSKTQGYKWLKEMKEPPKPGAEGKTEGVVEKGGIDALNGSIIEMRGRLQFLQKMIEEMRDKPVVEETLIGG